MLLPISVPPSDSEMTGDLVRSWLDRADQRAAAELHRRMQPCIRGVVAGFQSLAAEAEDLGQQISIRAFQALGRLDATRSLWPWLKTLAHRHCLTRLASAEFRAEGARVEMPPEHPALTTPPDRQLAACERFQAVRLAVGRLAPDDRRILELTHFDELPLRTAATVLGCPAAVLKVRAHRARHRLRAIWLRSE